MSRMERFYRFADVTFRVRGCSGDMYSEDGVLEKFRVDGPNYDQSVTYEPVEALPVPEGEPVFRGQREQVFRRDQTQILCMGETEKLPESAHTQIRREGKHTQVRVLREKIPGGISPRFVLNTLEAAHHITSRGGILLHCSFVGWGDQAILFTAPSGTGKSTQAALWEACRGGEVINGDRAVVKIKENIVTACGIPYCGTSGICGNRELPVAAIVYLTQAPQSEVRPLTGLRAFRCIWEGCSINLWDRSDVEQGTQTVIEVCRQVPVLHLACMPDESAVQALEAYLKGRK